MLNDSIYESYDDDNVTFKRHLFCKCTDIKIIQYVFYSPWLNRNFYEDYVNFCLSAGFTIAHLSTGHTIDYEDHVPLYRSPLLNRIKEKNIFTLIRERHGKDKRNFWCRDMLMVLVKPFFCSIDSTQTR